jgi:hypothetical protein
VWRSCSVEVLHYFSIVSVEVDSRLELKAVEELLVELQKSFAAVGLWGLRGLEG